MDDSNTYDVIVAGIGTMGAAACCHLAKRGVAVLGLEPFDIPHERGSHHGHVRMIRQAYFEHPDYVPLLKRAYELWEDLQVESGRDLFHQTGGLYVGPPGAEIVKGSLAAAKEHDLPHETLDGKALADRFPAFQLPHDFEGFCEERAGFLVPEQAVSAHAEVALRHGADLRAREGVVDWKADEAGVMVRTAHGRYRADHLIVTAGAWTSRLLKNLGIELTVTRQPMAWFWPREPDRFQLGEFPCWFIETESPFGHYGFPMTGQQPGFRIALHKPGLPVDPDRLRHEAGPTEVEIADLHAVLERFIPSATGPLVSAGLCLYTNSPDHHFVIGRHPLHEKVSVAGGFSGHGFKFASVVGEILADLAAQGSTELPVEFLKPDRFG